MTSIHKIVDPWPRMRAVVTAVVTGLNTGRFIEETLDSLRTVLGATSAWVTLGPSAKGGQIFRSRIDDFYGARAQRVSQHAKETMDRVVGERRSLVGSSSASAGRSVGVPLWSSPPTPRFPSRLAGAMYIDFAHADDVPRTVIDFIESVALLLGGVTQQQTLIDSTQEDLRATRAKEPSSAHLDLDELLLQHSMQSIRAEVYAAVPANASIMILGESGTGKTQLATAIARASAKEPIVRATLGLSDDLNTITSELFGHERGAFSGAVSKRKGLVEYADGGTLILDEVLNLPANAQQLLLDFTQFGTYRPLGFQGGDPKRAKLRLISVTNGNIIQAITDTRFRQDLYFRLATVPITMPPLRQRRGDISEIAIGYLRRTDPQNIWDLDQDAKALLSSPHLEWAGNIRELESVLERARNRLLASGDADCTIRPAHLDLAAGMQLGIGSQKLTSPDVESEPGVPLLDRWMKLAQKRTDLDEIERAIIKDALTYSGGVVAKTARELKVSRTGLISRMATLDVDAQQFKAGA